MWFINLFVILCWIIIGAFCVVFVVTELLLGAAFIVAGITVVAIAGLFTFLYNLIFK